MLGKNIAIKGIVTTILLITLGFSQVSLEIKNVDLTAGTLDIYMTNTAGCNYCPNTSFNNNTLNWVDQKGYCEQPAPFGDTTWVAFENITEEECAAIPGFQGDAGDPINGGWWFDGIVKGFQFELFGMTLTGVSGGLADEYLDFVNYNPVQRLIVGTSFGSSTIPVGEGVLTQISFSDFNNSDICFGEDTGSSGNNAISDVVGGYIAADWGYCYCSSSNPADECGVCGGDGSSCNQDIYGCPDSSACNYNPDATVDNGSCLYEDCAGECGGSAVDDVCGVCDGDGSSCSDYYGVYNLDVWDIPNDQGGYVYLSFNRSVLDTDELDVGNEIGDGSEGYLIERNDDGVWTSLQSIFAYGASPYQVEVRTLVDSTSTSNAFSEYRVIAAMNEGNFVSDGTII